MVGKSRDSGRNWTYLNEWNIYLRLHTKLLYLKIGIKLANSKDVD